MKPLIRVFSLIMVMAILAIPAAVFAQGGQPQDQVVLGDNYTLAAGQSVGNLNVFGGNVVLEKGSTVDGSLVVFGGNVTINGEVKGTLHAYGGQITLSDSAIVGGDVILTGGNLTRASGAQVAGSVSHATALPFGITVPNSSPVITIPRYFPVADGFAQQVLWFLAQTVGLTALAMLVILFAPKVTERVGDAALARPFEAGGLGLLVAILTPVLVIGFAITIIGIPITVLVVIAAAILLTFGWIAMGLEVGKRLSQAFHQEWPAVASAGLGTLLLSLVANGIGLTPCVGWIVPTLVGFIGMGGVLLTRFGTQPGTPANPPTTPPAPVPPATPA